MIVEASIHILISSVCVQVCKYAFVFACAHPRKSAGVSAKKTYMILEKIHIVENLTLKWAYLMGTIDYSEPLQSEIALPRKTAYTWEKIVAVVCSWSLTLGVVKMHGDIAWSCLCLYIFCRIRSYWMLNL